jgi:tetratricopeptide (TPR) repeat protein
MRFPSFRKKEKAVVPEPAPRPGKKSFFSFLSRKQPANTIPCVACGTLNPAQVNFCKECGSRYPGRENVAPGMAATAVTRTEEPKVWLERGNTLFRKGQFGEAVDCYTVALDIDPSYAKAWNNKALALEKMGNVREAQVCRQKFSDLQAHGR